jgi:hypothetical protein
VPARGTYGFNDPSVGAKSGVFGFNATSGVPVGGTYGWEPAANAFPPPAAPAVAPAAPAVAPAAPAAPVTAVKAVAKTPPPFGTDPWGYLTHPDNRLQTAVGGLGIASAMGAFDPKTGLNLPPRTYQRVNTSYNPGTVNPKYGMPGEPYFVGQGYGPETRETYYGAAGGGIRALSTGGPTAPYVPMTARGKMSWREDVPTDLDDSAAFKRYLKSDINKKEEKGQAEIDANVMAWLERYAKADVKGMAEGGPAQQVTQFQPTFSTAPQGIGSLQPYQAPNVPAMNSQPQQPQYQMSDFTNSPLFQQT